MSILDIQKRTRRLGEIRLGTVSEKGAPVKLKTLRLTSVSKGLLEQAAALWGGTVEPWDNKFSLITERSEIPVVIPPQDPGNLAWYELWSAGGLQRRCDGETEIAGDNPRPCLCDPDERQCDPTTRVQFMLPDIEDIGIWVLRSTGFYAAAELQAAMDLLLRQMGDTGWMPEATLAVEERTVKRPGQPTHKFVVPTIRLHSKLADLIGAAPSRALGSGTPEGETTPPVTSAKCDGNHAAPECADEGCWRRCPNCRLAEDEHEEGCEYYAEIVEVPTGTMWSELYNTLEEDPNGGNMTQVGERLRRLYAQMEATGHDKWGNRGLHAILKRKYNADHLGDLKRQQLDVLASTSFMHAKDSLE